MESVTAIGQRKPREGVLYPTPLLLASCDSNTQEGGGPRYDAEAAPSPHNAEPSLRSALLIKGWSLASCALPHPSRLVCCQALAISCTSAGSSLDDLHAFDLAAMAWTLLSAADDAPRPSARYGHGFTSMEGRLYVHGGYEYNFGG